MDISVRYNVPVTSDAVEIMHHISHINNSLSFGPKGSIAGKEVISRIITDLDTQGVMYTDTNGVHTLKRIRDHRETWTLNSSEPISDNYYPVNARACAPPPSSNCDKIYCPTPVSHDIRSYLHGSSGASLGIATDRSHVTLLRQNLNVFVFDTSARVAHRSSTGKLSSWYSGRWSQTIAAA
jgi:hypothetical protein